MKYTKKILAGILLTIIVYSMAAGLSYLIWNDWRLGVIYVSIIYGIFLALALIGSLKMLMDYIFND